MTHMEALKEIKRLKQRIKDLERALTIALEHGYGP